MPGGRRALKELGGEYELPQLVPAGLFDKAVASRYGLKMPGNADQTALTKMDV
ncbi:MAG: hypothetical protein ACLU9T_17615 [Blautia faecis]